jgi:hypothetical protein
MKYDAVLKFWAFSNIFNCYLSNKVNGPILYLMELLIQKRLNEAKETGEVDLRSLVMNIEEN